ncbi:MAG TPA: hypothetical protein VFF44_01195 [Casimicrobiaceae bacterium]|nr:hypothetical protein [Casimicrobiaceae bacterium]
MQLRAQTTCRDAHDRILARIVGAGIALKTIEGKTEFAQLSRLLREHRIHHVLEKPLQLQRVAKARAGKCTSELSLDQRRG